MNEEFVYQAVLNGDLEIDSNGQIWRTRFRLVRNGKLILCKPIRRRAEILCIPKSNKRTANRSHTTYVIGLMVGGKRKITGAHRLVWRHFHGPIPKGLTINHEDGDTLNNHPDNLTLATMHEQVLHAVRVLHRGYKPLAKLNVEQVLSIRARRDCGESIAVLSQEFGISKAQVSRIARRLRWRLV